MNKKEIHLIIILIVLLFSMKIICFLPQNLNIHENVSEERPMSSSYWNLIGNRIVIDNNWSLTESTYDWCTGSGTIDQPYVIENVTIDALGKGNCITISNTNDHFEIRNCSIFNAEIGIKIQNSTNFNVTGLTIFNINGLDGDNGYLDDGEDGTEAKGIALFNSINGTLTLNNITEISGGNGGNGGNGDWSLSFEDGGNGGSGDNSYAVYLYNSEYIKISNNNISKINGGIGGNGGIGWVGPEDWSYDGGLGGNGGTGGSAYGISLRESINITNFENIIFEITGGVGGTGGNGGKGTGGSYWGGKGGNGGNGGLGGFASGIQVKSSRNNTNTWNNLSYITGGDGGNGGEGGDGGHGYDAVVEENEGGDGGNGGKGGNGGLATGFYFIDSISALNTWNNISNILSGNGGNGGAGGDGGSGVYGTGGNGGDGGDGGSGSLSSGGYINSSGLISNMWNNISNLILSLGGDGGDGGTGGTGFGGYSNGIDGSSGILGENGTIYEFFFINEYIPILNDWTTTEIVSTESPRDSKSPSIGLDNLGNVHVVWHDLTNYSGAGSYFDTFYKVWNFMNGTWSTTEVISTESTKDAGSPSIGLDSSGNVYIAWSDLTNYGGSGSDTDIFYKKWNVTTATWSTTEVISTESTSHSRHSSIGLDNSGNVHITWDDNSNYGGSGTDVDIFYKRWNATTATWSATEVISTESTSNSHYPSIGLDDMGNVHVVWHDITNYGGAGPNFDIFYKVWNFMNGTWSTTEVISTESPSASVYPSIGLDGSGNVHIVWYDFTNYDGSGSDTDIFYKKWNVTSATWSTTEVVSKESFSDSEYPSIGLDNLGNVHVVWHDLTDYYESGTDWDIFYKMWNTTTKTWSTTDIVSKESFSDSEFPSTGLDGMGNVHVVWHDLTDYYGSGIDWDIFYKQLIYNNTAPEITINSPGENEFSGSNAPDFSISIIEPHLETTWYTINGGTTNITFNGITGSVNQDEWDAKGNELVIIRFYAKDTLGKEGHSDITIRKDIIAPNSSVNFIPHSGSDVVNESTVLFLTADDGLGSGVSLIRYKINDSSWITYSSPFTLANYPYGDLLILYQAVDQVDNYEVIQALIVLRTDTIAPTSSISFTPYKDLDIIIKSTTFTITTNDGLGSGVSLIRYKINDANWITYTEPFDLSGYEYGDYNITYQAIDVTGNVEIENSIIVTLVEEPSQPGIPGYKIFLLIVAISVVSVIIVKKQKH